MAVSVLTQVSGTKTKSPFKGGSFRTFLAGDLWGISDEMGTFDVAVG